MDILTILLQQTGHHGAHYGPMGGAGGFGTGFHWSLWWMLISLVILVGILYLVGQWLHRRNTTDTRDEALATLRQRYATGEIDEGEFEERRTRLR
jgi:putative membrane protein